MGFLRVSMPCIFAMSLVAAVTAQTGGAPAAKVTSPDGQITLMLFNASGGESGAQRRNGAPTENDLRYAVEFHGKQLIGESELGLELEGQGPLGPGMRLTGSQGETVDQSYTIPVGKTSTVRDHYNGVRAEFTDGSGRKLTVEARAFNCGVAFRYLVPEQASIGQNVNVVRELTQFSYVKDAVSYPLIVDGFQSSYEDEYQKRMVSGLHPDWLVALPYLANVPGIGWVAVTEADIDNYAGMYLRKDGGQGSFRVRAQLSPRVDNAKIAVETAAPFHSSWRVLMIADEPAKLIESNMILNLNPPSKIADTSWIKAGKSAWDWWSGEAAPSVKFKTGMNTQTMEHYIDFASKSGFRYMLIDAGWAQGAKPGEYGAPVDITKVNPAVDMPELLRYAKERNVKLWLWSHWTSVDKYMDQAFPLYEKWGIAGVKIDFMDRDDQWMVDWYKRVVENAAAHHLMIDFHGAFKPDGLRRTWPNLMTREGVMGKEYLKWSARVTPAHNATLPFTRMLAGPLDYTPGAFGNSNLKDFVARQVEPMSLDTRAQELALYVIFESPLEMVSDYPEHYEGQPGFDFIKRVPATWDAVHAIGGMPMKWISLARRSGNDWYVGSITNWSPRNIEVPLSFLGDGKYEAEIYADAPDAGEEATHVAISHEAVDRTTVLHVHMASGGGNAIWIHPVGGQ
ncbi:MAG TPA: glycoside hydrolase family 97 protein [Terracidiphilus sp.]|nr:glycoside hydrolase family 97 protein [Terracidiphilus sp.]